MDALTIAPACLHGATLTFEWASISGGRRVMSASILDTPGRVGACRYHSLWVEVKEEGGMLRGEPWVWAMRRPDGDTAWSRVSLTDKAAKALRAEIGAELRGDRFDLAWRAAFARTRCAEGSGAAAMARSIAQWWDEYDVAAHIVSTLTDQLTLIPVPPLPCGRQVTYKRPGGRGGSSDWAWAHPVLRVELDGAHVAYLDTEGHVLPASELTIPKEQQ